MEPKKIKVVAFDLEEVVVTAWRYFVKLIPDMAKLTQEQWKEIYGGDMLHELQYGRITEEEFLKWVKDFSGTCSSVADLKAAIRMSITEMPGIRYVLLQ